ncbi:MAG: amino acid permease [Clostridiaceae bacterium]|nr:amino acid permease [Clostridiaceae bacterium]
MNTQEGLQKSLTPRQITMIAIGGVIGAGLFVASGAVIHSAGPAAILSYTLAGLMVVVIMRMLGEMAAARPSSGAFAVYAGEARGPWAAYTIGWVYWYFWVITIAFEATAGAAIINQFLPSLPVWLTSIVLTALLAFTNSWSVRAFGEFEFWFASIKVATIIVFLIVGVAYILGLLPWAHSPGFSNVFGRGGFMPNGLAAVGAGVVMVVFSFFGSEIAAVAAAESSDPVKNVTIAIKTVVVRILMFYIGSIAVIIFLVPWDSTKILQSPFVTVFQLAHIPMAPQIMNFVVLTAVLSCLNSGLYTSSRIIYGIAAEGYAPKVFTKLSRRGVPIVALWAGTIGSLIAAFFSYTSPEGVFLFLINACGAVALLVYLTICISQIIKRKQAERTGQELVLKMWCFPYLSYLAVLYVVAIMLAMLYYPNLRSQVLLTALVTIIIMGSYFLLFKGKEKTQEDVRIDVN